MSDSFSKLSEISYYAISTEPLRMGQECKERGRRSLGGFAPLDKVPLGARAILLVTDHRKCHRFSILHKSHMSITDQRQYNCHRSQTYFLFLHKSKFLKKPNYKSRKNLCQKFIFVPAPSLIYFQPLFELKMYFLAIVLIRGSG